MDEERFNMSLRRLLKQFGLTAQREVEKTVQAALESGALTGREVLQARINMVIEGLPTDISVEGSIELA
jgi:glycerol kinase